MNWYFYAAAKSEFIWYANGRNPSAAEADELAGRHKGASGQSFQRPIGAAARCLPTGHVNTGTITTVES